MDQESRLCAIDWYEMTFILQDSRITFLFGRLMYVQRNVCVCNDLACLRIEVHVSEHHLSVIWAGTDGTS